MRGDDRGSEWTGVDARIDAALRSYAEPGEMPAARVAVARVLERVREAEGSQRGLWIWGWAAVVCFVVAVAGATWVMRAPRSPEIAWTPKAPAVVDYRAPISRDVPRSSGELPHSGARKAAHQNGAPGISMAQDRLPKLDVFPTPRPLTAEEQALVGFVRHGPPAVQRAVLEDQQHWDDPIIVADLRDQSPPAANQQDQ